jgi:hypothetical protein
MSIRGEAALSRQGGCVSRRVKHTDDNDFLHPEDIVDRVVAEKRRSQARREHFARNSGVRELAQTHQRSLNARQRPGSGGFRAFDGDIGPYLREVGAGRLS